MDYEKKYNEALGRAKDCYVNKRFSELEDTPKEICEYIFPELRESEDERARKEIVSIVKAYRENCIDEGTHRFDDCLSWLEKQKESLHIPDSIPSDCVSDAKCEDRWHKVEDFLPDNGREVLAKDKLGNTLLARYDGEGWDVSVYDNEDYRCHISISKWCEIPSERQKEQPQEELVYRMNGLMQEYVKEGKDEAEKGHRFKCYQLFWDALEDANFFEQKEQKPWKVGANAYFTPEQQPKQEWSEEDSDNLERVDNYLWMLDDYVGDDCATPQGKTDKIRGNIQGILSPWLKSLPERFNLQPKQEWSEEDEDKLEQCIRIVSGWEVDYDIVKSPYSNFLKSLRPSWKPSEEQKPKQEQDLPKWKIADKPIVGDMYIVRKAYGALVEHTVAQYVCEGEEYIIVRELEKLQKEK